VEPSRQLEKNALHALAGDAAGRQVTVTVDPTPLPAGVSGGVIVHCRGGRVVCDNTLETRYRLAFEARGPEVRGALFGRAPGLVAGEEATKRFLAAQAAEGAAH
jgi:vacuolar-type H+-ATPase subunit E/Vma4